MTFAAGGVASLAGCTTGTRPTTDTDTPASTTTVATRRPTTTADDPIEVRVANDRATTVAVEVRVHHTDELLVDRTLSVAPGEYESVDSGIRRVGEYRLAVVLDGERAVDRTLAVDGYDVRTGANVIVEVTASDVRLLREE
ncbi:hypothetical protein [Halobaculum marinum]|uniref:Ig-like domain-containing protein n=1 Tax=Halobaculum marinum TaxID=3031996 RepID=A0ABD5X2F7_9EURY|nr:hypothetical protein [Halobaculum sp. DT55]